LLGLGCVPALRLAFGMLRMPQSPRWLVMSGDDFAARATLAKIRVDDPDTNRPRGRRRRDPHPGLLLEAGAGDAGQALEEIQAYLEAQVKARG